MHMKIFRTRKIWRVSYVSVQEFFEFHMKQKQVIFKCFSLQALLIFQKEEEKVRCIQSPLCKRNWVTIPEHLCRLVSSPMVDSHAKTYHTILGSLQSSIILPSHAGKYAHTQHRYNSQFLKKCTVLHLYISQKWTSHEMKKGSNNVM